jgi:hypothetical protein
MLCNLPSDLQYRKLNVLDRAIGEQLGIKPISFRAGRWGYNQTVAENLERLGYKIDTSITPYTSWVEDHGPNFSDFSPAVSKFSSESIDCASMAQIFEIPATIGYLQSNSELCTRILNSLSHRSIRYLRLTGMLSRLRLIRKVWLSPEMTDSKTMIQLARRMMANGHEVLNLFFHSPSLKCGLSPFVRTKDDEREFLLRIREFLKFAEDNAIASFKLSACLLS